jgi:SAM-dependent methyltransferase
MSSTREPPAPSVPSDVVRSFYDRYPYPPPLSNLEAHRKLWDDPQRRRAEFHLHWPWRPFREDLAILVAGCGTSQAAKHAVRWPAASVLGIDFSAASIRSTEQLKSRHHLDNLTVRQLPIECTAELEARFDQIVCTGVLHHLRDPDAGIRALRAVLKPEGVLHLMLYAPYGRTGIYMMQEFCRRTGIPSTDEGMRQLMGVLRELPSQHPIVPLLRDAPDFESPAGLADALLNPQDRAYSVPALFRLLEDNGLRFLRWVRQAPYSSRCGLLLNLPESLQLHRLPARDESAAAELFRGSMLRHTAVVCRDDHPWADRPIQFSGLAFLNSVPIRLPDTVTVRERVPPGAAALLRNRSHAYADTVLPLSPRELSLVEAIDGQRTVGDLYGAVCASSPDALFLERMWWHDQIVFDASGGR